MLEIIRDKYMVGRERTDQYIINLTNNHLNEHISEVEFCWHTSMGNSSLVSEIAMQIIVDRCSSGFLPSISKLAEDYGVSKQTFIKAIDVLRNMGMAYTNSDYEIRLTTGENIDYNFSIEDKNVINGLMTYLSALQIIVIIVKDIAKESFPYFTTADISELEKEFYNGVQSPQKILYWIIQKLPNKTLKNFCAQLLKLSIHSYYLNYPTNAPRLALTKEIAGKCCKIIDALKSNDMVYFCSGIHDVYLLIFQNSKKKMLSLGIDEANKIFEPNSYQDGLSQDCVRR